MRHTYLLRAFRVLARRRLRRIGLSRAVIVALALTTIGIVGGSSVAAIGRHAPRTGVAATARTATARTAAPPRIIDLGSAPGGCFYATGQPFPCGNDLSSINLSFDLHIVTAPGPVACWVIEGAGSVSCPPDDRIPVP